MRFARWMAGGSGRALRTGAGLVLIGIGVYVHGVGGIVIAVVGLVPLLTGIFNICLIAPLLRAPVNGRRLTADKDR